MAGEVPFHVPHLGEEEVEAAVRALRAGRLQGNGPVCRRVEETLRTWLGCDHVLLTSSCTHALEMALTLGRVGPGDEVLLPSFAFTSCATAVVSRGARPVFAEIREDTLNLDPEDAARRITGSTRALMAVHYAGVACDMEALGRLADEHGLFLVEDAAQGVDAYHGDDHLGTLGDVGCLSFHATKNLTSGEGGALLTDDGDLAERAEALREKGTNRAAFIRGEVDKYTWVDEGSSHVVSDVLAAVLEVQLRRREAVRRGRETVWKAYRDVLAPLAEEGRVRLPTVPEYARPNYHIFYLRARTNEERDALLDALRAEGVQATFHFVPLHSSPYAREVLGFTGELPVTERCSRTLLRLPVYPGLASRAEEVAGRVADVVARVTGARRGVGAGGSP